MLSPDAPSDGAAVKSEDAAAPPPPESTDGGLPASSITADGLPASSIKYIMKRAMGAERSAITEESIQAVQRCSSEFASFVVSEARARVMREGRKQIAYPDIMQALQTLGFRPFMEPLKGHMMTHHGAAAPTAAKRPRTPNDAPPQSSSGAKWHEMKPVKPHGAGAPLPQATMPFSSMMPPAAMPPPAMNAPPMQPPPMRPPLGSQQQPFGLPPQPSVRPPAAMPAVPPAGAGTLPPQAAGPLASFAPPAGVPLGMFTAPPIPVPGSAPPPTPPPSQGETDLAGDF